MTYKYYGNMLKKLKRYAEAEDIYLEAEAIRVAKLIPILKPAIINEKPTIMPYKLSLMVDMLPEAMNINPDYVTYISKLKDLLISSKQINQLHQDQLAIIY